MTSITPRQMFPVALAALLALVPATARPCGAFFSSETDQNLALGAQRALLVLRAQTIELHLQPRANGDGAPFAWVLPVPAQPTLALGDPALLGALDSFTTPRVMLTEAHGGGLCAGDAADAKSGAGPTNGVEHFGGGHLGAYTWDLLQATDASALSGWLTDHHYVLPSGLDAALTPYLGQAFFVAVRLTNGFTDDDALDPLVVTYPRVADADLGYAYGLSRLSTVGTGPVLLWVLADKRYRVANYDTADLSRVASTMRAASQAHTDASYEAAITTLTAGASGRLMVTEFARDLRKLAPPSEIQALVDTQAFYLTRLYGDIPLAQMEDLVLTPTASVPEVLPTATADAGATGNDATWAVMWIGVLAGLGLIRRRVA